MKLPRDWLRRFAVRGVFWRQYLDWALLNVPFYFQPCLLFFWTLFFFLFAATIRRAVLQNLKTIKPRSSLFKRYTYAFQIFWNFAWTITDASYYKLTKAEFEYELEGDENLKALAASRGAIVLTAHMGNYDLGAALFSQKYNRKLRMVRAPEPDRATAQHVSSSLAESGDGSVAVSYNTEGSLLSFDLLNALRMGEIVSIQGDRVIGEVSRASSQLLSRTIELPDGPFILALVSGVPIFPLFVVRVRYRCYKIIVDKPIPCQRTSHAREVDVARGLEEWSRTLEATILRHWDQWYAFVPMFPDGTAG